MNTRLQKVEEGILTLDLEEQRVCLLDENNLILDKETYLSVDYLDKIIPSLKEKYPDIFEELKRTISGEEMISLSNLILKVGYLCFTNPNIGKKFADSCEVNI